MSLSAAANYGTSPGVFRASLEALGFILNAFKILPHASATLYGSLTPGVNPWQALAERRPR